MLCAQIRKTATEGNVAVIQCPYAKGYEAYLKYFCKGTYKDCVSVVKTDGKEPWAFQGRFSLHDNTEKKMFVVTITALRIEDTGQYCCGIESVGLDPFTVVQLTTPQPKPSPKSSTPLYPHTTKAGTGAVTTVTGYTGHSVQIRCPYESQYETCMKYLCGGECYTFQTKDIPVDSKTAKDERFSLNDDTAARVFTVTIADLRSEDGGKYWCGIEGRFHDHYKEIMLEFKIMLEC
ncbi:hypothetical protein P4O66_004289 [Electrophorus voltai]|uniref:Immunoglobulin domain-containing protein n=1 Tax=Electrophorus voltai TaxID=2609070 RepID=A0AAD8ZNL3_9TELE|nr:hypothetical protein P4O66_004289 [Electrophorus voltai]